MRTNIRTWKSSDDTILCILHFITLKFSLYVFLGLGFGRENERFCLQEGIEAMLSAGVSISKHPIFCATPERRVEAFLLLDSYCLGLRQLFAKSGLEPYLKCSKLFG